MVAQLRRLIGWDAHMMHLTSHPGGRSLLCYVPEPIILLFSEKSNRQGLAVAEERNSWIILWQILRTVPAVILVPKVVRQLFLGVSTILLKAVYWRILRCGNNQ